MITVESGTQAERLDTRTLWPKWMRRSLSNFQTAVRAAPQPLGLSLAGTAQSTTGTISTLMEAHAQPGWLCELVGKSDNTKWRENELVELLVDTGATGYVCGPHDFTHAALTNGPRPALKTATVELLKHNGTRTVDFRVKAKNFEWASQFLM